MAAQASPNLSLKRLEVIVSNLEKFVSKSENKDKGRHLLGHFPFDKMLEINMLDLDSLSRCIKILNLLQEFPEFYEVEYAHRNALDFLMLSLSMIDQNGPEVNKLLSTLNKILTRLAQIPGQLVSILDPDRLLQVIVQVTTLDGFDSVIAQHCYDPLMLSLNLSEELPFPTDAAVIMLFQNFKKVKAVNGLCLLAEWVILRGNLLKKDYEEIFIWLINVCPLLLNEEHDDKTIAKILKCLAAFTEGCDDMKKYNVIEMLKKLKPFFQQLIAASNNICLYSSLPGTRPICLKLLAHALCEFSAEEEIPCYKIRSISKELQSLPNNPQSWPKSNLNVFLFICYMIVSSNNGLLWKHEDVARVISHSFYANRHNLNVYVLKAIFFLYPVLAEEVQDSKFSVVGFDLLKFLENRNTIPIYTYNDYQLRWILSQGSHLQKMHTLRQWLNKIDSITALTEAMKSSKAGKYLLRLLLEDFDKELAPKLIHLIKNVKDAELGENMALLLGIAAEKHELFNCLILAEPGIPLNSENSLAVCTLMGIMITSINDSRVLRGACIYSSKLLSSLKHNPESIKHFCMNLDNIKYLVQASHKVDEETAVEILRLFSVVVIIKKHTGFSFERTLATDFTGFFRGTNFKLLRTLKLLSWILICKDCFLQIDQRNVCSVYFEVCHLSFQGELAKMAYTCLLPMLSNYTYLAKTVQSCLYVKKMCCSPADVPHLQSFLKTLQFWMRIIKKERSSGFCDIPTDAIRSLILRSNLPPTEKGTYLSLVEDLEKNFRCTRHLKQEALKLGFYFNFH